MRQIVLDTETTGLNPRTGDRIIEVGCVEIVNRRLSGRTLHHYVNPGRSSDPEALAVHGITDDFLADKPGFEAIVDELLAFCAGAEIVIHNASFDVAFLDEELRRLERTHFKSGCHSVIDTYELSKRLEPGKRHSLDAMCDRYGVSNARRNLHGALLDAELLAEVYLAMTRGQESLVIDLGTSGVAGVARVDFSLFELIVVPASAEELKIHEQLLDGLERQTRRAPIWRASV
ncbi:DNA polymerase III subunit epsilon [soil metagenome]